MSLQQLVDQYRIMHQSPKKFRGGIHWPLVGEIAELVRRHGARTLLDYGSGKGRQYEELRQHEQWGGIMPKCYDPGWPPFATKPTGKFDGVICTDVAEHIPPECIDWFLADVIGYATKFVFFFIATEPAKKLLPDGRNAHLTLQPADWWRERIAQHAGSVQTVATFRAEGQP